MQDAKDSFYEMLRNRLALLNPDRTVVVRGVTRPAVVVDENEDVNTEALENCYHLRWTGAEVFSQGELPLLALRCEVAYSTEGNAWNGRLDRGRLLASMDADLLSALRQYPQNAAKSAYSVAAQGLVTTEASSRIWWSDVVFSGVKTEEGRLTRTAAIDVMCFEEGMVQE